MSDILTEEELNKIENSYGIYLPGLAERYPDGVNLIASHRNLISANAELKERNRLLVLENDELLAELEKLKAENVILQNKVMMHRHIKTLEETK